MIASEMLVEDTVIAATDVPMMPIVTMSDGAQPLAMAPDSESDDEGPLSPHRSDDDFFFFFF